MRTVTFQNVLYGVARLLGLDPYRDLNTARAGTLTEYIQVRLQEGWKFAFWPEWTVVERRAYRVAWSAALTVVATDEVYLAGADRYYQALQGQAPAVVGPASLVNGEWVTNLAYWAVCCRSYGASAWVAGASYAVGDQVQSVDDGNFYQCFAGHVAGAAIDLGKFGLLTAFSKYVAYEQVGETAMDEVKWVTRKDPRVFAEDPGTVGYFPTDVGIQVQGEAPGRVWVRFRKRVPQFTSTQWMVGTAYQAGAVVYYVPKGECYVAKVGSTGVAPGSDGTKWVKQDFPLVLMAFVKLAAAADGLTDQKQADKAVALLSGTPGTEDRGAYGKLSDAHDQEFAGQGQWDRAEVVGYGGCAAEQWRT